MTKLTLSMEKAIVDQAKRLAAAQGKSVSAMFSEFVREQSLGKRQDIRPGRLARKASGLAKLPKGKSDKQLVAEALMHKYGEKK